MVRALGRFSRFLDRPKCTLVLLGELFYGLPLRLWNEQKTAPVNQQLPVLTPQRSDELRAVCGLAVYFRAQISCHGKTLRGAIKAATPAAE